MKHFAMKPIDIADLFADDGGRKVYDIIGFNYEHRYALYDTDSGKYFSSEAGIDHCVSQLLNAQALVLMDGLPNFCNLDAYAQKRQPALDARLLRCADAYATLGLTDKAAATALQLKDPKQGLPKALDILAAAGFDDTASAEKISALTGLSAKRPYNPNGYHVDFNLPEAYFAGMR